MGDTQENWVTPWNGLSYHLKYHLKLKTKDIQVGEEPVGGYQEKHSEKGKVFMHYKVLAFSIDKSFCSFSHLPLLGEADILTNGKFLLQKANCYSVFRDLLWLQFLKNNQPEITNIPERHILGWHILFLFSAKEAFSGTAYFATLQRTCEYSVNKSRITCFTYVGKLLWIENC